MFLSYHPCFSFKHQSKIDSQLIIFMDIMCIIHYMCYFLSFWTITVCKFLFHVYLNHHTKIINAGFGIFRKDNWEESHSLLPVAQPKSSINQFILLLSKMKLIFSIFFINSNPQIKILVAPLPTPIG